MHLLICDLSFCRYLGSILKGRKFSKNLCKVGQCFLKIAQRSTCRLSFVEEADLHRSPRFSFEYCRLHTAHRTDRNNPPAVFEWYQISVTHQRKSTVATCQDWDFQLLSDEKCSEGLLMYSKCDVGWIVELCKAFISLYQSNTLVGCITELFFFFFPKARLYFHCSRPISIHNLWLHSAGLRRLKQPFNDVSAFLGELWCKPL